MIQKAKKRKMFFNQSMQLIRSKKSRLPAGSADRSDTIRNALYSEYDPDFIDFIEVSSDAQPFYFSLYTWLTFIFLRPEMPHNWPEVASDPWLSSQAQLDQAQQATVRL